MISNIENNCSFTGRPNIKKILPRAKSVFAEQFRDVQSPSAIRHFLPDDEIYPTQVRELNKKLRFTREFRKSLLADGQKPEYFRGFVGILKTFKVANCDEFAEFMKIILRINKIKNCDMYALYSQKGNAKPSSLDHCIVALNIPKSKNNKIKRIPFQPKDNVKIIDMWWQNGFIGNVKKAKKLYKALGLKDDEKLLLRPLNTPEPDKKCFDRILKDFPQLKIKKPS